MTIDRVGCVSDAVNIIGEGPVWIESEQALYWVDVGLEPKTLLRYLPATGRTDIWPLPNRAAAVRGRREGGLLITFQRGLGITATGGASISELPLTGVDFDNQRFNDSIVDPMGRLWIGSYDRALKAPLGELYRIDSSLNAKSFDRGFMMSNGIAITPDARTLFHTDSRPHGVIYKWDFDCVTGEIANRRVFLDFQDRSGRPDGCAIDSDGCLWVAEIDAGQLIRIDPDGAVIQTVALPVTRPTSLAFGGPDLKTIFITSMTFGVAASVRTYQPFAGRLLAFESDTAGHPQPLAMF